MSATGESDCLVRENEALRRRVAVLEAEAERFKTTLQSIGDAVISVDTGGKILQMNPVAKTLTGWRESEALGQPLAQVFRIINEDTRAEVESPVGRVLREGVVVGLANHTLLIAKDGKECPIADSGAPIRNQKGETTGVVLVFRDQTEERAAQRRYQELFDNVAVALLRTTPGPQGGFADVNPAMVKMFEADSREQLMALRPSDVYLDADQRRIVSDGIVATGRVDADVRFKTLKGKPIWCHITGVKTTTANGQICFDNTMEDITERKTAEEALRQSEEKYRGLFDNAEVGMYRSRLDGSGIVAVNQRLADIFGFSKEEMLASPATMRWADPSAREEMVRLLREHGELRDHELDIVTKGGDVRTVLASMKLYPGAGYLEGTAIDITERKAMEQELLEARGSLERRIAERTAELQWSQQLLAETSRLARVGGWEIDLRKNELTWTDVVHQIHEVEPGYRPTVEAGINFYAPEAVPVISEAVHRAIEEGQPFDVELQLITFKKKRIWVRAIGEAIRENGTIVKVRGVFQDIDQRKLVDLELKDHRERLEELVEARTAEVKESQRALVEAQRVAQVGSWEWDAVKDEITGSQEFYRLFDVAPEDIARYPQFAERLHPDDRARVEQDVAKALHLERPYDTDYRVKLRDGGWRDINARGQAFLDDGGKPLRMVGTCLDITERKRAEAELRIKNQVFEDSIASQSVADKDGTITHVNPAFLRLWGYASREEATGKSVGTFFANPADATPVLEALAAHDAWEGQFLAKRTDSSTFVARGYATSLRSAAGALIGYQSTNLDVTRERENEAALRESERKFRDTVRYLDEGYYCCAVDGVLHEHNVAFNRILGFKPGEDLKGSKLPDFWQNPEDRKEYLRELASKGIVRNFLVDAKTISGDKLVVLANSHVVKDENGNPVRIEGTFTDFTERKRMEERISHLNLVLKAIRNVNQLIVREKDPETLIRRSCEVLTETRGYFSAWIALYDESGKYLTAASAGLDAAFETLENRFRSGQLAACDKAVHERGVHVVRNPAVECPNCPVATLYRGQSAIAVRLEHVGHVHGLLVMSMDAGLVDLADEQNLIDEVADDIAYALHGLEVEKRRGAAVEDLQKYRDQLEQRVRERTAQLKESNKELEAFSYSVSHDLRAPLRAIDGFTRILADDYGSHLDAEGKRLCSIVRENTKSMGRLIDDLLAFSRLGRAEMNLSQIDMGTMANSVFHELTTPESRARIDFQVGAVPSALADPTLMRQVWMNLLANAIKFSSKRQEALIKVSGQEIKSENVYAVQDNGAGFDMQYVGKLFGVFQRLHSSKEFEGTGVGLALVQRVIRRHGGRVWAQGEPDKGATFCFALQQKGV